MDLSLFISIEISVKVIVTVEACVAKRLTPQTLDLEVQGSSLTRRVVSLDKEVYYSLLFTQVYKWVATTYIMYCWG